MSNAPKFRIALSREALKYYNKVSTTTAHRLDICFAHLESNPLRGPNIKLLTGTAGKYRYKLGALRIIYEVNLADKIVSIIAILPRGQAYKHSN